MVHLGLAETVGLVGVVDVAVKGRAHSPVVVLPGLAMVAMVAMVVPVGQVGLVKAVTVVPVLRCSVSMAQPRP